MLSACADTTANQTDATDVDQRATSAAVSSDTVRESTPSSDVTATTVADTSTTTSVSDAVNEDGDSGAGARTSEASGAASTTSPVRADIVPSTVAPAATHGEVPDDLMQRVLADAADRLGIEASALTVMRSEAVVWNDGSLGCPEPGVFYTQEIIDGYWVELAAGDDVLDYRINANGAFFVCENDGPRP